MINRMFKVASLLAVDPWTMFEMGYKRSLKSHKKLIQRKRRMMMKRDSRKIFKDLD